MTHQLHHVENVEEGGGKLLRRVRAHRVIMARQSLDLDKLYDQWARGKLPAHLKAALDSMPPEPGTGLVWWKWVEESRKIKDGGGRTTELPVADARDPPSPGSSSPTPASPNTTPATPATPPSMFCKLYVCVPPPDEGEDEEWDGVFQATWDNLDLEAARR